jgi:hypothetical protein
MFFSALFAPAAVLAEAPRGVDLASLRDWDIVVAEGAQPAVLFAAEELQSLFEKASGVRLSVMTRAERPDRHVFIGWSDAMGKSNAGFDVGNLGAEDLRIVVRDANITIAGGGPRGTLYGVYTFLEDYLGVRFLTVDHTHEASISAYRLAIEPVWRLDDPSKADRQLLDTMRPLLARFLELCERNGVDHSAEHVPFAAVRARLEGIVRS